MSIWLKKGIADGFAEQSKKAEDERMGRVGEVPLRARRAYAELLTRREPRIPQSLGGVRGLKASPLRFGEITDIKPPDSMDLHIDGPLDSSAINVTRVGLNALNLAIS